MGKRERGTVSWYNAAKGFGMINADAGRPQVFVHFSALEPDDLYTLMDDDVVEFEVEDGPKGPMAKNVRKISGTDPVSRGEWKPDEKEGRPPRYRAYVVGHGPWQNQRFKVEVHPDRLIKAEAVKIAAAINEAEATASVEPTLGRPDPPTPERGALAEAKEYFRQQIEACRAEGLEPAYPTELLGRMILAMENEE